MGCRGVDFACRGGDHAGPMQDGRWEVAVKVSVEYEIEADMEQVYALLTDPDYLSQRSLDLGELSVEIEVTEDAGETIVSMKRTVARDLPAFLAKVFSSEQEFELVESWRDTDAGKQASYSLNFLSQPVTVTAEIVLTPSDAGCIYAIEHRCKAKIPLIGGRVEKFVLGQVIEGCDDELAYLAEAL